MFRTSELRLILTARNEASRTVRKVARDVGRLDDATRLRMQVQQLQNMKAARMAARGIAAAELESLTTGRKRLELDKRILQARNNIKRAQLGLKDVDSLQSRNYQQQIATLRQLEAVERRLRSKRLSDFSRDQLHYRREELLTQQVRLAAEEKLIPGRRGAARRNVSVAKQALNALSQAEAELGIRADYTRVKLRNLDDAIDHINMRTRILQDRLSSLRWEGLERGARAATHIGFAMATTGAIGTAALTLMAKNAAELSKQVTLAATQARPMNQSFAATAGIAADLNNVILDQIQKFPAASQDMADSLYEIFSGTNIQNTKEAANTLELFNKMAVAGGTDLKTMTQAGISLLNNYVGKGPGKFKTLTQAVDLFFSAVRYGRFSAKQFADSLSNVLPIAEAAGLGFKDVADAMAFLTRQSGAKFTPRDATGLARLIEVFGREDVQNGLRKYGIEVENLTTGRMIPLLDIMKQIQQKIKLKPGSETLNFFKDIGAATGGSRGTQGTIQARRIFAFMLANMQEYENVSRKVNKTQGEFMQSFNALSKTPGVRWDVTINQLKALIIMLGQELIPILTQLAQPVIKLMHWFNQLNPSTKHLIAQFLAFTAVGSLVLGTFAALTGGAVLFTIGLIKLIRYLKLLRGFGKVAAEAAIGAKALAAEGGFMRVGMLGALTSIVALTAILPKFHSQILEVLTGAQGLEGVFKGIGIILAGFTINATIKRLGLTAAGFAATARSAGTAGVAVGALLTRLKLLRGPIVVTIALEILMNRKQIEKAGDWLFGKIGLGGESFNAKDLFNQRDRFIKTFGDEQYWNAVAKWADNANKAQRKAFAKLFEGQDVSRRGMLQLLQMKGIDPNKLQLRLIDKAAKAAFEPTTGRALPEFIKDYNLRLQAQITKRRSLLTKLTIQDPHIPTDSSRWIPGVLSDAKFIENIKRIQQLKRALEEAPNYQAALEASRRYHNAVNAMTAKMTDEQKAMFDDLIGMFDKLTEHIMPAAKFAAAFAKVNDLRKAAENSTDPSVIEKYYKAQDELAKNSGDIQMRAAEEAASNADAIRADQLSKAKAAAEKAADLAKQNVQNAQQALQTATSTLQSFYENALSENQSMLGELFNGPFMQSARMQENLQFGITPTGKDILADLFSRNRQFSKFQDSLQKLRQRGGPEELVAQIRQLGPEAQAQLDQINKMTPQQFNKLVGFFNKGQKLVEQATQQDLNRQVRKWESFGKKVARAIITGIRSENVPLENALWNRVLKMYPGLANQAHAKPRPFAGVGAGGSNTTNNNQQHHKTVNFNLPENLKNSTLAAQLRASYFIERNLGW